MTNSLMAQQMTKRAGFIAALDQSGGSSPKTLSQYGIAPDSYQSEEQMFALIHAMRVRIIKSSAFTSREIIGTILFERTMDSEIDGMPVADYLWQKRGIMPFLKVDQGLLAEADGVQMMKPIAGLNALLEHAAIKNVFGTKMRSTINAANEKGIAAIVAQQFEFGQQIHQQGFVPILEPEVNIKIADKSETEDILRAHILTHLNQLPDDREVILKLSLPTRANHYRTLIEHPRVMRVVALSGGYSRDAADALLRQNNGVIASFSRALIEGLSVQQTDAEFDKMLAASIASIFAASKT